MTVTERADEADRHHIIYQLNDAIRRLGDLSAAVGAYHRRGRAAATQDMDDMIEAEQEVLRLNKANDEQPLSNREKARQHYWDPWDWETRRERDDWWNGPNGLRRLRRYEDTWLAGNGGHR